MKACSDQSGDMGHIHHEQCAYIVRNRTESFKINYTRIRACSGYDQFRTVFEGCLAHFIIINQERILLHAISHKVIQQSGSIHRAAVRQMAAMRQVHSEDSVARIQRGKINRHIGLGTGVRLHIGMIGTEELLGTVTGQILHDIHIFTTAIIPFARIAFGIFIREHRTHRFHYSFADDILRGNKLNIGTLTAQLQSHRFQYCRVTLTQLFHDSYFLPSAL
ncbi:hypothetical protein D3C73_1034170 [compost metagenome]